MKYHPEFSRKTTRIVYAFIFILLVYECSFSQDKVPAITLIAEQQKPHNEVSFVLDQMISYKTVDSKIFANGRLKEITDSTLSFENKDLTIMRIRYKDLVAFKLQGSYLLIDLTRSMTAYNLKKVFVKLKSGKRISGKLVSIKGDSLAVQIGLKKPLLSICYSDIESVGMHKKGTGGIGAVIGGLGGGGIGAIIGVGSRPDRNTSVYSSDFGVGLSAIAGFLLGAPIGAAVGATNKQHLIQGDSEKFRLLAEKINKKLWVLRVPRNSTKN